MRKVALTGAVAALVLALAGVVAASAASLTAEPTTHKARTLTFHVVFSPFTPIAADNEREPNSPFALGDEIVFHDPTATSPASSSPSKVQPHGRSR
jgi:hypothetical protein